MTRKTENPTTAPKGASLKIEKEVSSNIVVPVAIKETKPAV